MIYTMLAGRIKLHAMDIFGAAVTGGSAITAWQAQAQWALSVTASFVAIIVGLLTARSLLKKASGK